MYFLPYEYWDIDPTSTGDRRISKPSTVVSFCGPAYFQGPFWLLVPGTFPTEKSLLGEAKR